MAIVDLAPNDGGPDGFIVPGRPNPLSAFFLLPAWPLLQQQRADKLDGLLWPVSAEREGNHLRDVQELRSRVALAWLLGLPVALRSFLFFVARFYHVAVVVVLAILLIMSVVVAVVDIVPAGSFFICALSLGLNSGRASAPAQHGIGAGVLLVAVVVLSVAARDVLLLLLGAGCLIGGLCQETRTCSFDFASQGCSNGLPHVFRARFLPAGVHGFGLPCQLVGPRF